MAMALTNRDPWNPYSLISDAREPPPREAKHIVPTEAEADLEAGVDRSRRPHDRLAGPFDGCRMGLLETPVRTYDLSVGGCFVDSLNEQQNGSLIVLKIDLPLALARRSLDGLRRSLARSSPSSA